MDFDHEEELNDHLAWSCPNCGYDYNSADYEDQICSNCGHVNDDNVSLTEKP